MAAEQGAVPGGEPQQPAPSKEQELAAELEQLRGRSKIFKAVSIVAAVLFVLLAAGGFYVYRRVMAVKNALEFASQGYQQEPAVKDGVPEPVRAVGPNDGSAQPVQSSLSMFSLPSEDEGGGETPGSAGGAPSRDSQAAAQQALKAMNKYAAHPLVKEFMADLKQTPDYKAATGGGNDADPVKVLSQMRNSGDMRGLIMKYARRPEFLGLMQQVMQDPEMTPLMGRMPPVAFPSRALPQPERISGPTPVPKAAKPAAVNESEDTDNDGELTFDASAVSGGGEPRYKTGAPPPPVDSGH